MKWLLESKTKTTKEKEKTMKLLVIDPNTGIVRMATPEEEDREIRQYNKEAEEVLKKTRG